ncbi:MAG: electron transport complex subunit RsxA [Kiritimatiellae bacterium]|nr:electron transport complex subunit RsxA [Kiritimatiellia bacterium]
MRYLIIVVGAVLVNNFVLSRFLGCCPFLGVSKKTETAVGMSAAVVFVMTIAAAVTWALEHFLLHPLGLDYIHTLAFILVIAALVQFIDIAMKKFMPPLHAALGIFLPLITTNCAVLGVAELNSMGKGGYPFFPSVFFAFAAALGFGLALVIFSGIREKLAHADPPRCFRGIALALVTAGLLALAFMGFSGLVTDADFNNAMNGAAGNAASAEVSK